MLFIHETHLVYKLKTSKNCKEVKHIMIMIIAIIYIFVIICDILSTVENYYQKILRIPLKKSSPSFLLTSPLKIQKVQVPLHFDKTEDFQAPLLAEREGKDTMLKALSFFSFFSFHGKVMFHS